MRWASRRRRDRDAPAARRALIGYAVAWLVAAAAAVGVVFVIFGDGDDDTVNVPPVRETELTQAAGRGRCQLHRATEGERLNPPVDGPANAAPARPGLYDEPVSTAALTSAMRHGIVVIQFRPGLEGDRLDELETLQAAVPAGTIVAPNATGMKFELAVTAYRRLLACPRFTTQALDAVQLFRGRFLGSGPDAS